METSNKQLKPLRLIAIDQKTKSNLFDPSDPPTQIIDSLLHFDFISYNS